MVCMVMAPTAENNGGGYGGFIDMIELASCGRSHWG
jgi:hypothetical protein